MARLDLITLHGEIGVGVDRPPPAPKELEEDIPAPRWVEIWVDDARQNVLVAIQLFRRQRSIIRLPFRIAFAVYYRLGNAVAQLCDPAQAKRQRKDLKKAIFDSALRPYMRGCAAETDPATGNIAVIMPVPFGVTFTMAFTPGDADDFIELLIAARHATAPPDGSMH